MKLLVTAVALPTGAIVLWLALRTPLAGRLLARPREDRWHEHDTPSIGGVGIFAGLLAGAGAAIAIHAAPASTELLGILGGCAVLFATGLADDLWSLGPLAKLAGQGCAAAIVLLSGLSVQIVSNDILATAIAVFWLIGMTNAFNLLDNMDGLAASLAAIACAFFAIDSVTSHPSHALFVLAASVGLACISFLPFNLRPRRRAAAFMGDSGSQVLGFALAALGLASSWKVAGTTVATLLLPLLVLAVPILDTTLVTIVRLLDGRPIYQGGRDHTSHRLVYHGLSERRAVVLLAVISAALGGTSLAYNVLGDWRITAIGVLLTFALLVQFGSFLSDVERRPDELDRAPSLLHVFVLHRRRLVEVLVDFVLVSAAFATAYLLRVQGSGSIWDRHLFQVGLPVLLFARYLSFIPLGLYRGVWRYAGARDGASVVGAVVVSEVVAFAFLSATQTWREFPRGIFIIDALICTVLIGASRFWERAIVHALSTWRGRTDRRRTLIVGAGRGGRSLLRELRETPGEHVIGFIDDDPRLRRRRLQGTPVLGSSSDFERILATAGPNIVLVTIPDAPRDRLDPIVEACARADVPCRFVRRETDLDPRVVLGAAAE